MKTAIFSGIVAALLALSGVQNFSATLPAEAALDKAVEDAIRAKVRAYETAFNAGDAPAMARMWTPDGSYVNTDGWVSTGREQLEKLHAHYFGQKPHKSLKISVGSISESTPDTVVERGITSVVDDKGNTISRSPYIAIHRRIDGEWLLQSVVEMSPQSLPAKVADLNWMLGSWKAANGENSVTVTNKMQPGGRMMLTDFEIAQGKATPEKDMMVTTVDPATGKLMAFMFDSNGGYGRGIWQQEQGKWFLTTHRVKPDGSQIDAVHVLSRDDENTMRWSTVNRTADGVALKDIPDVTVTRTTTVK